MTRSTDSTRPFNLSDVVSAQQQQQQQQQRKRSVDQSELDGPQQQRMRAVDQSESDGPQQENDQPQKPLDLATLVDRVRQVQKTDPDSLRAPILDPASPAKQPQSDTSSEQHQHWYSSVLSRLPHQFRHLHDSESSTSIQEYHQPDLASNESHDPSSPRREMTTVDHVASAFASTSRAQNLETIDFTVESLAVTGAAAPAFLLRTDEKGRRPPPILFQLLRIGIVDSEVVPEISRQIIFRIELQYGDIKWVIRRTLYEFYKLHLTLSAKRYENLPRYPGRSQWPRQGCE
ncbi:hypothetical protein BC939DRAFT_85935 [Gamsiella multidivaricata]|uniref:uncharacterized protein n=1 Tax=Gamsiella multidivaricata TaxID=101098 RepID=UPI00221FAA60|nr:uncharacterized protein BC939DRAFT_85935 [Gamsiella multidivaricata]KAI7827641.1 hypothetical protein BC939DRAFT_85935 [Gamsiella multidivaricata]